MPGIFTISLDLELFWGSLHRWPNAESHRKQLESVHAVVPRMLELFAEYEIRVSWAVVGLLYAHSVEEARAYFPATLPTCAAPQMTCYQFLQQNQIRDGDTCYFAPDLIDQIRATPGQEIACHGFAHLPYTTPGVTVEDVRNDLRAARCIAESRGDRPTSLIFPRNRWERKHVDLLPEFDFASYRAFAGGSDGSNSAPHRLARFLDAYIDLGGDRLPRVADVTAQGNSPGAVNIPATRFLRPATGSPLDAVRLRRITRGIARAARQHRLYHLWWHPHNFGRQPERNLSYLREILERFRQLRESNGLESRSMEDWEERVEGLGARG